MAAFESRTAKPAFYWTWRLLTDGYTAAECAQIRGLTSEQLLDHAVQAAEAGLPVRGEWFLTPHQIAELTAAIGPTTPQQLRPILARLPAGTSRQHVQLFLHCRDMLAGPREDGFYADTPAIFDLLDARTLDNNGNTGDGCGSEKDNSDPFYHWGGLLALVSLMENESK